MFQTDTRKLILPNRYFGLSRCSAIKSNSAVPANIPVTALLGWVEATSRVSAKLSAKSREACMRILARGLFLRGRFPWR